MLNDRYQVRGTMLALISAAMFALLGYLGTQLVHDHFSIENMLFWRFLVASLWITGFIFICRREYIVPTLKIPKLNKIFFWCAVTYSSSSALYFVTCLRIGTGAAMVLFYAFPIFVAIFAWLRGTWQLSKLAAFALAAVLIGMFLLKGNNKSIIDWTGIFLGLLSAFIYACYLNYSKPISSKIDSAVLTLLVCLGTTLVFFLASLLNRSFTIPVTLHDWMYIICIGILVTALPIQLLLDGLKYISPVRASAISVVEPVLTLILGLVLLHESVSTMQTFGIVIVLIGALLLQFERPIKRTKSAESS